MVKRWNWKRYAYLAFAFIVLILSWETNRTNAAIVEPEIPEQSIRLRILANSDAVEDQAVKRRVRDAVIEEMNGWVGKPASIEEAREIVRSKLPELSALVGQVLKDNGFAYGYKVELGVVPFPTKMYGNKVYPAGDYEALRITLGDGAGQNWWCVLFPPLCFVDIVTGEAAAKDGPGTKAAQQAGGAASAGNGKTKDPEKAAGGPERATQAAEKEGKANSAASLAGAGDKPRHAELKIESKSQIRFYFWEKLKALFA